MVIQNQTCSDPSPASPAAGCTRGSSSRPCRRCSRSIPPTRSAGRIPASLLTGDGYAPRFSLSGTRSQTPRCTWAGSTGTCARGPALHAPRSPLLLSAGTTLLRSGRPDCAAFRTATSFGTWVQSRCGTCIPISRGTGFATLAYGSPSSPTGPSRKESLIFRADVGYAATAEPKRVHGQRPWFQNSMTKEEECPTCMCQGEPLTPALSPAYRGEGERPSTRGEADNVGVT